ncbi:HK97 family phage major capsid protein [Desulfosalsimonas propionicica]|uniref:HK97 family phage major capsid protein n=1 Tax=Desulfosalsimonas propionicica TaxID=332175 RepID=A0A7W0HMH0_9BACT|nr:phage major capsid protein [Desulfosalsimonas propionicica]MBA2883086.1 HK97 family phage major capsid protein [Desulfosalsimonas propionicica]
MSTELSRTIEELGKSFEEFKAAQDERLAQVELAQNRIPAPGNGPVEPESGFLPSKFCVTLEGQRIPVLEKSQKLSDYFRPQEGEQDFSLGDYVKASMGLRSKAVTRGPETVPTAVSMNIIDAVRTKSRVMQAGSMTIPIEGKTNLLRIEGDPTVFEHSEGVEDISESEPSFTNVELDPGALVAAIPLTMEIVQDSLNLDAALQTSITAAMARKLDSTALSTILADTDIPTNAGESPAVARDTETWSGVLSAVGDMLALDMDVPTAMIANAADYIARAGQQADSAGNWLGAPPILSGMADLQTTGIDAGRSVLGGFNLGFAVAVRHELRLEVIRFAKHKSATHVLVAYARMAGYVIQPNALFIQDKDG